MSVIEFHPSTSAPETTLRAAPHNIEAEQALLGCLLYINRVYERFSDFLRAEHFYHPAHQRIYIAATTLLDQGKAADSATIRGFVEHDEELAAVGGAQYPARLVASVVTVINAQEYAHTIYDCFLRRQLIEISTDTLCAATEYGDETTGRGIIEQVEKKLFDLAADAQVDGGFIPFAQSVQEATEIAERAYKRNGKTSGISTGLIDLDELLGGLHPSDLLIIAGRPSMGKTALAVNLAVNVAKAYRQGRGAAGEAIAEDGGVVGFYSLEMSNDQLATRVIASHGEISSDKIRKGGLSALEFERFREAGAEIAALPLHIDPTPALSISAIRTRARRQKRRYGLDVLIIDYLQLISSPGRRGGEQNRVQEVSEITRQLKALAKELNVPVIALSQLSRAVEQREDKRPQLSDLRESGSIEQDADCVMFVYREEYYLERSEPQQLQNESEEKFGARRTKWAADMSRAKSRCDVIVGKNRHGPIGTTHLHFNGEYQRFGNIGRGYYNGYQE